MDGSVTNWTKGQTQDLSGDGNTGQLEGMSTTTSPALGKIGQALNFNGSTSYVDAGTSAGDMTTNSFSLSLWMKTNTTAQTAQRLINKRDKTTDVGYEIYLESGSPSVSVYLKDGSGNQAFGAISTVNLRDLKWHHVVVVFNRGAGNAVAYVDGAARAEE
jgi:hypothetical protein